MLTRDTSLTHTDTTIVCVCVKNATAHAHRSRPPQRRTTGESECTHERRALVRYFYTINVLMYNDLGSIAGSQSRRMVLTRDTSLTHTDTTIVPTAHTRPDIRHTSAPDLHHNASKPSPYASKPSPYIMPTLPQPSINRHVGDSHSHTLTDISIYADGGSHPSHSGSATSRPSYFLGTRTPLLAIRPSCPHWGARVVGRPPCGFTGWQRWRRRHSIRLLCEQCRRRCCSGLGCFVCSWC